MKNLDHGLIALALFAATGLTGCVFGNNDQYFEIGKTADSASTATGTSTTAGGGATTSPVGSLPGETDTTPTATPNPTAAPCTETCSLENGLGVQSCGQTNTCTLTKCNDGYVVDDGECVQTTSVDKFQCTSYEKLVLNATNNQITTQAGTAIPAQDVKGKGLCYYYPMVVQNPTLTGASSLTGTSAANHDQTVVARDHDVDSGNPTTVWHPYNMAHVNVNFMMSGARILNVTGGSVSGSTFTTSNVQIDNFFLVGVFPQSTALAPANMKSYYSAWGTGDSTISVGSGSSASNGIAFNPAGINLTANETKSYGTAGSTPYSSAGLVTSCAYAVIPLNAEASGGTASVPEVSVTNLITPNVNTTIDFHALDCGSSRTLSSIYLLVQ